MRRRSFLPLCVLIIAISFAVFILSLLSIFPKLLGVPILFFSILLTVSFINNRHRFRGFE